MHFYFKRISLLVFISSIILLPLTLTAATTSNTTQTAPSTTLFPASSPKQALKVEKKTPAVTHLKREAAPLMVKPFGMPGVIGLENNQWVGSDYLGSLSPNIIIDLEIRKTASLQQPINEALIKQAVVNVFKGAEINTERLSQEGPPLPFMHVLIMVYPLTQEEVFTICSLRLFEEINVVRKNFVPSGYWQGITWESQDTGIFKKSELDVNLKDLVEKNAKIFTDRYRQYNPYLNKEKN